MKPGSHRWKWCWKQMFLVIGFYYLAAYLLAYWYLPGHAITGKVSNGSYYVDYGSIMTEVEEWQYHLSFVAFWGLLLSIALILAGALGHLFAGDRDSRDEVFGSYRLDHEPHCFRLVIITQRSLVGSLLLIPVATVLTAAALLLVETTVLAIFHAVFFQQAHPAFFWALPFLACFFMLFAVVFSFNALRAAVGLTTRVSAGDDRFSVFEGFGPLGWTRSIYLLDAPIVSRQTGGTDFIRLDFIEILSGQHRVRFGHFLNPRQKTKVLKVLQTEFKRLSHSKNSSGDC